MMLGAVMPGAVMLGAVVLVAVMLCVRYDAGCCGAVRAL